MRVAQNTRRIRDSRDDFVVANDGPSVGRHRGAYRRAIFLGVAALDQLLDVRRQDPGEAHVPVPILDLVPVMVFHVLDAPLDLAGPTLRAVPFDSRREDEPLAPADQDVLVAD